MVFDLGKERIEGLSKSEVAMSRAALLVPRLASGVDIMFKGNDRMAAYKASWKASLIKGEEPVRLALKFSFTPCRIG